MDIPALSPEKLEAHAFSASSDARVRIPRAAPRQAAALANAGMLD